MTILSTVCTKLLCTNAHLGRRVAADHLKVYIRGFRNGIAILDSDKTLICLRNAIHFIGSLIRKKGRSFFLKTNHFFIYSIMEKMWSCINDSQWKIGAFLTNSYANPKKFRSRKNQINFGLNQQPDCVVILHPDRKSSVILEADRSLIPIASLVDSTIPCEFYKRINYPIPANDPILFVYLFRHSITKTVILERKRKRITAMNATLPLFWNRASGMRTYSSSSASPGPRSRGQRLPFYFYLFCLLGITLLSAVPCWLLWYLNLDLFFEMLFESLSSLFSYLCIFFSILTKGKGETRVQETLVHSMDDAAWDALPPIAELLPPSPGSSSEGSGDAHNHPVPAAPPAPPAAPVPPAAPIPPVPPAAPIPPVPPAVDPFLEPEPPAAPVPPAAPIHPDIDPLIQSAKREKIYFNLTTLYESMDPKEAIQLTEIIFEKKENILGELINLNGPVNGQILWRDGGDTIRNPKSGGEYSTTMLNMILDSLRRDGRNSKYYEQFLNHRMHTIKNDELMNLELGGLPMEKLDELNQAIVTAVQLEKQSTQRRIKEELRKLP